MFRWLLILTIALLPLRGWVASAMPHAPGAGTAMMVQAHAGPQVHASGTDAAAALEHEDCMGHEAAADPAGKDTAGTASTDFSCPACSDCQACSAVGPMTMAALLDPVSFGRALPAAPVFRFASAERALGFKPPIS